MSVARPERPSLHCGTAPREPAWLACTGPGFQAERMPRPWNRAMAGSAVPAERAPVVPQALQPALPGECMADHGVEIVEPRHPVELRANARSIRDDHPR